MANMDVRTLCLGILTLGDATGYEIKKTLEGPFSHFFEASYGSIYPALNRLTEAGLVECTPLTQKKRPDKKVYSITPAGRLAFMDALAEPPGRDRLRSHFLVLMAFAELLPARHLSRLIDARLAWHRAKIAELEACGEQSDSAGRAFVCGYGLAFHRAAADFLEENRHRVEGPALLMETTAAD